MKLPKQTAPVIRAANQQRAIYSALNDTAEKGGMLPSNAMCVETCKYKQKYLHISDNAFQECLLGCR